MPAENHCGKDGFASLFQPEPVQWGLRGDPYLWAELARAYESAPTSILTAQFASTLSERISELLGDPLSRGVTFVERYAHSGMSSGQVGHDWWIDDAIPLLLGRLQKLHRRQFLEREFAVMSIIAGFATRDRRWPVYRDAETQVRDDTKVLVRQLL